MQKLRGFTLIELLIVVAIIAILAAIAVPNFLEAQTRSKVSRVRSDQRSMATAIETYYVDNNEYPAMTNARNLQVDRGQYKIGGPSRNQTQTDGGGITFRSKLDDNDRLSTLTTPIAYITSYFPDPFADVRGTTFRYYTDGRGWILGSWGPDVDQANGGDLEWGDATAAVGDDASAVETVYDSRIAQPSQDLLTGRGDTSGQAYTYDPTNGTVSPGDVWRVKQ